MDVLYQAISCKHVEKLAVIVWKLPNFRVGFISIYWCMNNSNFSISSKSYLVSTANIQYC